MLGYPLVTCQPFLFLAHTNILVHSSFSSVDKFILMSSAPLTVSAHV
jgi:hypothetical protein